MFKIKITNEIVSANELNHKNIQHIRAYLNISDDIERLALPISYWNLKDYTLQWEEAARRLLEGKKSAIITQIYDPTKNLESYRLEYWQLFKDKQKIYVQNGYQKRHSSQNFNIKEFYNSLNSFKNEASSEWCITKSDIEEFIRETKIYKV